jgi:hypothetical protein
MPTELHGRNFRQAHGRCRRGALGLSRIAIPIRGRADSLNVSVSASILLYSVRSSALTVEPGLTG